MTKREQLVQVYDDTRGRGHCRSCDATLTWYETVGNHRRIPFDGDPVARDSNYDESHRLVLRLSADDVHFRTCPDADRFRRR